MIIILTIVIVIDGKSGKKEENKGNCNCLENGKWEEENKDNLLWSNILQQQQVKYKRRAGGKFIANYSRKSITHNKDEKEKNRTLN